MHLKDVIELEKIWRRTKEGPWELETAGGRGQAIRTHRRPLKKPEQQKRVEDRRVGFGESPQPPSREDSSPSYFLF